MKKIDDNELARALLNKVNDFNLKTTLKVAAASVLFSLSALL